MHGVSEEMCWGGGGGREVSCGKRYGGCGGRWREVCWSVGGGKERCWGGVWESVLGEWGSVLACGERNGGGVGKCVSVWAVSRYLYRRYVWRDTFVSVSIKCFNTVLVSIKHIIFVHRRYKYLDTVFDHEQSYGTRC